LQPRRQETFKLSSDPLVVNKVRDIVGLYMNPPLKAMVLCVEPKAAKAVLAPLEDTMLGSIHKKGAGEFTLSGLLKISVQQGPGEEAPFRQRSLYRRRALVRRETVLSR
jgi:hypothetical protein